MTHDSPSFSEKSPDRVPSILSHVLVYLALMALLGLTAWLSFVDLGHFSVIVPLGIAVLKALLVVLFFMEVLDSRPLTRIYVFAGVAWLLILLSLTLSDYATRDWLPLPGNWPGRSRLY